MARGALAATQIVFDVQVAPAVSAPPAQAAGALDPKLKSRTLVRYNVQYVFRGDQIEFAAGADGTHTGSLELDLVAYDTHGQILNSVSQKMTLPLKADAFAHLPEVLLRCAQQIDLPEGGVSLRLGMLDMASGSLGTLEIPLTVIRASR
jgi:hypothetical protein